MTFNNDAERELWGLVFVEAYRNIAGQVASGRASPDAWVSITKTADCAVEELRARSDSSWRYVP